MTALDFFSTPTYFGVELRQITHICHHLVQLLKKTIFTHHTTEATCRLRMNTNAEILCTAALCLVYSTAEYCAPVWCHSAYTCLRQCFE